MKSTSPDDDQHESARETKNANWRSRGLGAPRPSPRVLNVIRDIDSGSCSHKVIRFLVKGACERGLCTGPFYQRKRITLWEHDPASRWRLTPHRDVTE